MGNTLSEDTQIPIVYRDEYNIRFLGLQKHHPFDSEKFGKIAKILVKSGCVQSMDHFQKPEKVSEEVLSKYHTKKYLEKIATSDGLMEALEFHVKDHVDMMDDGLVKKISKFCLSRETLLMYALDKIVISALKYQCGNLWFFNCFDSFQNNPFNLVVFDLGGTILAGELAMDIGWSINIGGGMHHSSSNEGGGWCVFADIQMSIMNLRKKYDGKEGRKKLQNVMIVDFDVHRGNGYAIDKSNGKYGSDLNIFIVDIFERGTYPRQNYGLDQIDVSRGLFEKDEITDEKYLQTVKEVLDEGFQKIADKPDIVYYNAGSDILLSDPFGGFKVSEKGMVERDRLVFEYCLKRKVPVVMMTSGGYAKENAKSLQIGENDDDDDDDVEMEGED